MHDLRRTLGSWQAAGGASLLIIGKSLGHRSESATRIYARLATDPVRESVEKATVAMINAADGTAIIKGGASNGAKLADHQGTAFLNHHYLGLPFSVAMLHLLDPVSGGLQPRATDPEGQRSRFAIRA
jgi:hypothetical protein